MNTRKITYILAGVLAVLLIIIAISFFSKDTNVDSEIHPITIVADYFEEMYNGNFENANNYYLEPNMDFYSSLMNEQFFYKEYWKLYGIDFEDEEINDNTATVGVIINKLDYVSVMLETKQKLIDIQSDEQTYTSEELERLKNKFIVEAFENNSNKVVTNAYDVSLVKDDNGNWKIVCDNVIKDILFGNVSNR